MALTRAVGNPYNIDPIHETQMLKNMIHDLDHNVAIGHEMHQKSLDHTRVYIINPKRIPMNNNCE